MSASSKKKLRKEQNAAAMTEKQLAEQKEAKTLKRYTVTFVIVMILVVAVAIGTVVRVPIVGAIDRGSHAVTVGEHKLSTTDLSYYFVDAISDHYNAAYDLYGSYAQYFLGFTTGKPLNEQTYSTTEGTTWADYFIETGINNAQSIYALYDTAMAEGFELSAEEQESLDTGLESIKSMADIYGYSSANAYLRATYGNGANMKTYTEYYTINSIAAAYYSAKSDSLTESYTDEDYREYEKDKYTHYSSFTYATYVVDVEDYLEGGTKGDDGKTTYSDAEWEAARAAAKADADKLAARSFLTADALDTAIRLLRVNKGTEAASTKLENVLYADITDADIQEWVSDEAREADDIVALPKTETSDDDEETEEIVSYTIVYFQSRNDNDVNLIDVQHILIMCEGGSYDSTTGVTTYTDEEKAEAKARAEEVLAEWKAGEATKETFAEFATKYSEDTGSNTNGGLYQNVYPGQMVANFNDWCFDQSRQVGDTGIVESDYGYHIMYFTGTKDQTYRDYMIETDMLSDDLTEWHDGLTETVSVEEVDLSRMEWDYTFG